MKRIHHYCHLYHSAEINQTETPSYVFLELFAKFAIAFSHQTREFPFMLLLFDKGENCSQLYSSINYI